MKQANIAIEINNQLSECAQIMNSAYMADFETWLGYEFWSSQLDFEPLDDETKRFTGVGVMEEPDSYQMAHIIQAKRDGGNDVLPF